MKPLSDSQKASLEAAVSQYEATGERADQWLQARGIGPEWRAAFRLGVVADPIPGDERFRGRLAVPSLARDGHPVSLRFRDLDPQGDPKFKMLGRTGEATRLFNPRALHQAGDSICITEGEFDAIALEMCGLHAVGVTGVNNWKKHMPRLFAGFSHVYLLGDGDSAGREFNAKLERDIDSAVVVPMPDGMDVNALLVAEGRDAVRSLAC